ncbi:MAG: isocitrate/isopropylmalate dehydrogenase family protein [Firmicutes bacterium]|nr:isocitrate/isopropylmalate dehydrogenase family protein [Bacillota bacterium]
MNTNIEKAKEKFGLLLEEQLKRVEAMNASKNQLNFSNMDKIIIGVAGGDGIGPVITAQGKRVIEHMLAKDIENGRIELRDIEGLTIENRAAAGKAIPDDVLDELKKCHVILKGPTTTPRKGDPWPNIESANVMMRKELDLFANVRPVRVPEQGIDWTFFRENTEGAYAVGSKGFAVDENINVDFTIVTQEGTERIIRAAFEYARKNGKNRVTAVTKANIIKATDGKFLEVFYNMAKEYPNIKADDWYIDIMTAKLIDEKRRRDFQVVVLPNLYGDIITDEAAEFQGGVGTAGSSNIGNRYAMFEAIHGSAPRMVDEGRAQYADPCSVMRAVCLLLSHIGYQAEAEKLSKALDICTITERKVFTTGHSNGATNEELTNYIIDTIKSL